MKSNLRIGILIDFSDIFDIRTIEHTDSETIRKAVVPVVVSKAASSMKIRALIVLVINQVAFYKLSEHLPCATRFAPITFTLGSIVVVNTISSISIRS